MNAQKMVRISLLVALAAVLSIIENQFAIPLAPWLKLGLANIMTLLALEMYGMKAAIAVSCLRSLIAGIFGTLPMLVFSFSAALASSAVMGILFNISRSNFSIVGLSVIGAVVHNATQLFIAYLILKLSISSLIFLSPFMLISATVAGIITGLIAKYLSKTINARQSES